MSATTGFYGNQTDSFYVAPSGRIWQIQSEDDLGTDEPVERDQLPDNVIEMDDLVTPEERLEHLRRIEAGSGESLIDA